MEGCRRCHGQKLRERCTCTPQQVGRYRKKISGPLLDRIDMKVAVDPVDLEEKFAATTAEPSNTIRERVAVARERQAHRFAGTPTPCNAFIPGGQVSRWCQFDEAGFDAYRTAVAKLNLSTRATDKLAKLSRTVADLACQEKIGLFPVFLPRDDVRMVPEQRIRKGYNHRPSKGVGHRKSAAPISFTGRNID